MSGRRSGSGTGSGSGSNSDYDPRRNQAGSKDDRAFAAARRRAATGGYRDAPGSYAGAEYIRRAPADWERAGARFERSSPSVSTALARSATRRAAAGYGRPRAADPELARLSATEAVASPPLDARASDEYLAAIGRWY